MILAGKTNSLTLSARVAGLFYLAWFIVFVLADIGTRPIGANDNLSVTKFVEHEQTFRWAFVADVIAAALFLMSAWALYVLLKSVNSELALLLVLLNLAGVAVQCGALGCESAVLLLLDDADYLKAFPADQQEALANMFLNLHQHLFMIAQIFYGLWLFPLGYLVYKSNFLPRPLGILLILDGVGILIWFLQFFLFPGNEVITYPGLAISFVAEISLALWLSIRGAKRQVPVLAEAT